MKRCTKCHQEKLLDAFNRNKRYKDGRYYWCRECLNPYRRKLYRESRPAKYCLECSNLLPLWARFYCNIKCHRKFLWKKVGHTQEWKEKHRIIAREWARKNLNKTGRYYNV